MISWRSSSQPATPTWTAAVPRTSAPAGMLGGVVAAQAAVAAVFDCGGEQVETFDEVGEGRWLSWSGRGKKLRWPTVLGQTRMWRVASSVAIFSVVRRVQRIPVMGSPATSCCKAASMAAITSGVFFPGAGARRRGGARARARCPGQAVAYDRGLRYRGRYRVARRYGRRRPNRT